MQLISAALILLVGANVCLGQKYYSGAPYQQQYAATYPVVPILSYYNDNNYDGSYKYGYETGNGISVQEQGVVKNQGQRDLESQTAQGTYSYTSPEGIPIQVRWYADETGFHAEGAHLPTPPPIPAAIAKSLAYQQQQAPILAQQRPPTYSYYPQKK